MGRKNEYDNQLSGLTSRPSEVVYQEDDSPSPTAEAPETIEQDEEGASKSDPSFLVEFVDNLL